MTDAVSVSFIRVMSFKHTFFASCLYPSSLWYSFTLVDIGTPQKKDYFLCAETPGAAKAWVATLQ